ncbi:MAG TPA: sugar phosphate isomerase/epimerase family protein [Rectinemataceae bacterium]|nr:sugar phosphate isomerase/epimerase family protein [Rectinemataceae bacterium]
MRLGLFSVSYAGLWGQHALSAPAFIRKAGALGYEGVLLMAKRPHLSVLDAGADELREIEAALDGAGVQLIGLAAYNDFLLKGAAELPVLEMQLSYVRECIGLTRRLGGGLVRVFTGYERADEPYQRQWAGLVAALRECGRMAEDEGIVIAVQNHHDLAVDSEAMARLLDEVGMPNVRAGYDAWSPALRGEELEAGALDMAPRTAMTIAADYCRLPRWRYVPSLVNYERLEPDLVQAVAMGEGFIDYDGFFSALERGGFDGWAVYEMCSPLAGGPSEANLDAKAAAFVAWMRARERGRP